MILSTSAIDAREQLARAGFFYLAVTLVCAAFGAVYEIFSHGVYSYFMLYAFAFPLCGGVLPCFLFAHTRLHLPCRAAQSIYRAGIATCTAGSIVQGILEIYGTTNRLTQTYWYVGVLLLACGMILWVVRCSRTSASQ